KIKNEKGKFADIVSDIKTIVDQLDSFADADEYEKAYDFIQQIPKNDAFETFHLLWRMARVNYKLSQRTTDNNFKKKLIEHGFSLAEQALKSGNDNYAVHKWYGILLNEKSQFNSSEEQIRNAFEVKKHFEEAIRLNPTDATSKYLLGIWHYEVAHLSAWKRRIAKLIYGKIPESTIDEALKYFKLAEETDPGFYNKNMLM
ncbi:unnamed protein product, partial [Didymodactylos carnosus]